MWNRADHKTSVRRHGPLVLVNRRASQEELRAHQARRDALVTEAMASASSEAPCESMVERALRWLPMLSGGRR
jgi:hypothetical protein